MNINAFPSKPHSECKFTKQHNPLLLISMDNAFYLIK